MARLPIPGQDTSTWGDVLNTYLLSLTPAAGEVIVGGPDGPLPRQGAAGQTLVSTSTGNPPTWVNGLLNIMAYGAVNNGTATDDTAAFNAAWADAIALRTGLFIPPGVFYYNGPGLSGNLYPTIVGAGSGVSTIILGTASYLLKPVEQTSTLLLTDIALSGGYGAIQHMWTGTHVQRFHVVNNCHFSAYTRACIEANASDFPYWKFKNCQFDGANFLLTMGIALPGLTDQDSIIDCSFIRNRVNVKLNGGGDNAELINCDFFRWTTDRTNGPTTDVWIVPETTSVNAGTGLVIRDCKFGNEGLVAGDFRILVADEDAGATFGQRWPKATTDSTGFWVGASIENNGWFGSTGIDVPFIFSTTPNLMGLTVGPLMTGGVADTAQIVKFLTPALVSADRNTQTSTVGPLYNAIMATENVPAPKVANAPGVIMPIDDNYVLRSRAGLPLIGPGTPADYRDLLGGAATTTFTLLGGTTKTNTTDALGGTNACTVTFPAASLFYHSVAAMTVGQPIWIEFDIGNSGGTNLAVIQVYVRDTNAAFHWRRTVEVPTVGWHTYKFPFVPRTVGATPNIVFQNQTGATGMVNIGRVRCYHATEPIVGGTIPTITGAKGGNVALTSLITQLASLGLIIDGTT